MMVFLEISWVLMRILGSYCGHRKDASLPTYRADRGHRMNLARAIHFDESDQRIFHSPAQTGEWCISGGFEFSDWTEADLEGKARQAFSNGWLGLSTFGRVTFVAVTQIEQSEVDALTHALSDHFVTYYGAPSLEAAKTVAYQK